MDKMIVNERCVHKLDCQCRQLNKFRITNNKTEDDDNFIIQTPFTQIFLRAKAACWATLASALCTVITSTSACITFSCPAFFWFSAEKINKDAIIINIHKLILIDKRIWIVNEHLMPPIATHFNKLRRQLSTNWHYLNVALY